MGEQEAAVHRFSAQYADARTRYPKLPALETLDKEFDMLEFVGREEHFPRNAVKYTRWFLMHCIESWMGYLHQFILPNQQNAVSMEEYNCFTDKEKEQIIDFMNWIMYRSRVANALQLTEDDTKSAAFVGEVLAEWQSRKPALETVVRKNADLWKAKLEKKQSLKR